MTRREAFEAGPVALCDYEIAVCGQYQGPDGMGALMGQADWMVEKRLIEDAEKEATVPEERDSLIDGYEARIQELEAEKAELVKQFEPFITAEFARILCELREGDMEREIAGDFRKVVKAVMDTGRKGIVTAVFTITRKKEGELRIDLDSKTKIPKFGVDSATVFVDEDGNLHRKNPAQMSLFERKENKNA